MPVNISFSLQPLRCGEKWRTTWVNHLIQEIKRYLEKKKKMSIQFCKIPYSPKKWQIRFFYLFSHNWLTVFLWVAVPGRKAASFSPGWSTLWGRVLAGEYCTFPECNHTAPGEDQREPLLLRALFGISSATVAHTVFSSLVNQMRAYYPLRSPSNSVRLQKILWFKGQCFFLLVVTDFTYRLVKHFLIYFIPNHVTVLEHRHTAGPWRASARALQAQALSLQPSGCMGSCGRLCYSFFFSPFPIQIGYFTAQSCLAWKGDSSSGWSWLNPHYHFSNTRTFHKRTVNLVVWLESDKSSVSTTSHKRHIFLSFLAHCELQHFDSYLLPPLA